MTKATSRPKENPTAAASSSSDNAHFSTTIHAKEV